MLELESNNFLNFNRTVNSVKGEKSRGGFCGGGVWKDSQSWRCAGH